MNCAHCCTEIADDDQPAEVAGDVFYPCRRCGHDMFSGEAFAPAGWDKTVYAGELTEPERLVAEIWRRGLQPGEEVFARASPQGALMKMRVTSALARGFRAERLKDGALWYVSRLVYPLDAMKAATERFNRGRGL